LLPQRGEMTGLAHQHAVAGRERVDERRFPGAGSRGRVDHYRLLRLEHRLEAFQDLEAHLAELGSPVVDGRLVDRAQDAIRNVRRTGNLQEVASALVCHAALVRSLRTASLSEIPPATMISLKPAVSWAIRYSLQKEPHGSRDRHHLRRGLPVV